MVASSKSEIQSHSTLPAGVATRMARWPIANVGRVPMPIRPSSCWRNVLAWRAASCSDVIQLCPEGGTYCRSSSQMMHCAGGASLGEYCVPQVVQMKEGMGRTHRWYDL